MSVLATMTPRADQAQTAPRQQASDTDAVNAPAPSWMEAARANWRLNEDDSPEFQLSRKIGAYADLGDALARKGYDPSRYVQRQKPGAQMEAWDRAWADLEAERRRDPNAFADIPKTRDEFDVWAANRKGQRAQDIATAARGGIGTSLLPGLGFGLLNGFQAENLPFLFMGGGSRNAAEFVAKQFVAGAQMTAIQAPQVARARADMGEAYTPGQLGTDLVMGGAMNAGIGAVATYGPPLLAKALKLAPHERPPLLQAAINVLQRAEDVDATNPFERTHTGSDAHLDKLAEAMARIDAGRVVVVDGGPERVGMTRTPTAPMAVGDAGGDPIGAYMRAAGQQESGGRDTAANAASSSSGRYGFTNGTWTSWYRKVFPGSGLSEAAIIARKTDRAAADRVMRAMSEDNARWLQGRGEPVTPGNLYVVHHMGQGGARAIFEAAPGAPLADLLGGDVMAANPHLRGMTAGQFIAWADKRMGGDGSGAGLASIDVPAPVEVRPDALDAVRPQVTFEGRDVPLVQFSPADIGVDAQLMQFKSGGDQFGVTDRLQGVQRWDPMAAGVVTVWEANDGRRLIADGHQRLGLAKRILAADPSQPVMLNAFVLREADGFSAIDARVLTALKNIGEGTGSATDAAKVFRDVGLDEGVISRLPPRSALVRDGKALARLSPEAFGAAINEVIPESYAAAIGHLADDPATHAGLVALLNKIDPPNRAQAESVIRQALDAGFITEEQFDMFGGSTQVTALFANKAKVLDKSLAELRKLKGAFSVAARNADALDAAGNKIDVDASTAAAEGNARALDLVSRLALRKGNAVSAIFNDAAERLARGEPLANVVRDTVRQLGELDLANVLREAGSADGAGEPAGGSGRGGFADDAPGPALDPEALTPATRDELEAAGQGGFALFDEEPGKAFDDPAGEGVQAVADSAWHDAKAAVQSEPVHPVTGESMAQVAERARAIRDQFPAPDGGHAGTHNIPGSAPVEAGGTRADLRASIAQALLDEPALQERTAHLVLGPPAAGKSSFADPLAERWGARIIDSDEAKAMLPEFADGVGAMAVHEESALIAEQVANASIAQGDNILLPLVGKTYAQLESRINDLVKQKYRVYIHLVDLPNDKAVERAIARFGNTGRFVDPQYVKSVGTLPVENYQRLIAEFGDKLEGHSHVSNDVARGEAPQLIDAGGRDPLGRSRGDRGTGLSEGQAGGSGAPGSDLAAKAGQDVSRVDPNIAAKTRQEADIAAQQPLTGARKTGVAQDPAMPEGLFGGPQEPTFDLGDGKGERTLGDIEAELDADQAAIDAIKGCLL